MGTPPNSGEFPLWASGIGGYGARPSRPMSGPVVEWIHCGNPVLANGAFRAMAMLREVPDGESIGVVLALLRELPAPCQQRKQRPAY
jgi:hypothetical protein